MADWIDRNEALRDMAGTLPALIGLDTEFMRIDTFYPKLALVQLASDSRTALIDPLAVDDTALFGEALAAPERTCIMHSASEDLEALTNIVPRGLGCLFDTQIAAAFAGLGPGLGYQRLVHELTGVELPKAETRSDWLRRPLSAEQLEYAAQDVTHLADLHGQLSERLAQRGYAGWHAEDCRRMVERARRREPDPQPQMALRGAAGWPLEKQALLRRILLWRDVTARAIDRPRSWLLDDPHALDLAFRPPADGEELHQRSKGLRALRGPQRAELLSVLNRPLEAAERDIDPIPALPTSADKRVIAALKAFVNTTALQLDLPEGLLCARRHLESLLATRRWPTALEGWRRQVLFDGLMTRLPDGNSEA
ncbi:ribonuclease D [Dokdonella koreensis]|uniref:Ribonuclease D n=1 Tax=Dokdonella koreensis DS-123 TaxID=1300342 RepID=A0A160DVJ6_9GAMM|nr:ribonuclease D [Dokdonella koreensis]ANB18569.1 Ribonuclease D [Dokdonella koreensis DS-123]